LKDQIRNAYLRILRRINAITYVADLQCWTYSCMVSVWDCWMSGLCPTSRIKYPIQLTGKWFCSFQKHSKPDNCTIMRIPQDCSCRRFFRFIWPRLHTEP